jgi:hypothetical protein
MGEINNQHLFPLDLSETVQKSIRNYFRELL